MLYATRTHSMRTQVINNTNDLPLADYFQESYNKKIAPSHLIDPADFMLLTFCTNEH